MLPAGSSRAFPCTHDAGSAPRGPTLDGVSWCCIEVMPSLYKGR